MRFQFLITDISQLSHYSPMLNVFTVSSQSINILHIKAPYKCFTIKCKKLTRVLLTEKKWIPQIIESLSLSSDDTDRKKSLSGFPDFCFSDYSRYRSVWVMRTIIRASSAWIKIDKWKSTESRLDWYSIQVNFFWRKIKFWSRRSNNFLHREVYRTSAYHLLLFILRRKKN